MKSKKQIKQDRLWEHFKYFLPDKIFKSDLTKWHNYNPELYKQIFLDYQSYGRKNLTLEQLENIKPLLDGQRQKEIFLNSVVMEIFEWDSKGWGWIYPIDSILSEKLDRLTRLSLLKIRKRLRGKNKNLYFPNRLNFYLSHPIKDLWPSEFGKHLSNFKYYFGI